MSMRETRFRTLAAGTAIGAMALMLSSPAQAIVPNDNFTPDDIVDNDGGVNGVGMFFRNDGFVCSGTLINPRTVLFAAHCVNDRPESDYGTIIRSAFSFDVNALPGFISWISNSFSSFPDQYVYDISQIQYNPQSLERPQGFGFLEGDIALATLARPVTTELDPLTLALNPTIPTWALLFSPLPSPASIDPNTGTGYHVNITGYGRSGSGTFGAFQGIDWRRRAAENMLGGLMSLDERNDAIFGPGAPFVPQNLYQLDFDDPRRTDGDDTTFADFRDINVHRDDPLEREGTTAGGDSGGPLILDAANNNLSGENLQIGVLSGGTSFFGPSGFSSYGSTSFYQPLYLFWEYIVAASPYRYVSAVAGDGAWEDPNHWVTELDPMFRVIANDGTVVNGLPTSPGAGILGTEPDFGEVCIQSPIIGDPTGADPTLPTDRCENVGTGETSIDGSSARVADNRGVAPGDIASNGTELAATVAGASDASAASADEAEQSGSASNTTAAADLSVSNVAISLGGNSLEQPHNAMGSPLEQAHNTVEAPVEQAHNDVEDPVEEPNGINGGPPEYADAPNPAPTLENGLPGATGFVPDNVDPVISADPAQQVNARYYDVTLDNAGTTTLSSTVMIDRLTVAGPAKLDIRPAGDLTTWIDIQQAGGWVNVDGTLGTFGDYLQVAGLLSGSGTVRTPFLTSVMGMIAPGQMGTTGTLTIDGNLVLSSGSTVLIDLADGAPIPEDGDSDRIVVTGIANLGGTIAFGVDPNGPIPENGDQYLVLTADGGRTDTFDTVAPISAILNPVVTYGPKGVRVVVLYNRFADVVDPASAVQTSYAHILDANVGTSGFGVFPFLLLADQATLRSTIEGLAPIAETTRTGVAMAASEHMSRFYRDRLQSQRGTNFVGGTIATVGQPIETAALATDSFASPATQQFAAAAQGGSSVRNADIDESMAIYLAGGYINGSSRGMPALIASSRDDFDGYFIAGGIEHQLSDQAMIGYSLSFTDISGDAGAGQTASAQLIQGTLYGQMAWDNGFLASGQISAGLVDSESFRTVNVGPNSFNLRIDENLLHFAAEAMVGKEFGSENATFTPNVAVRYADIGFDYVNERGDGPAMQYRRGESGESLQVRAGVDFDGNWGGVRPRLSADYVHDFIDDPDFYLGNFVGGHGIGFAPFALGVGQDSDWAEISGGLTFTTGDIDIDLSADTTLFRSDVRNQSYRATVTVRF